MTLRHGAVSKKRSIVSVRALTREDLPDIAGARAPAPGVARFRDPHHRLARLYASGLRHVDVAAKSGYSIPRCQQLHADPAFQELIASYRKQVDASFVAATDDYYDLSTSNMLKAERQIAEKLDEADEDGVTLPTRDLIAISRDAADRFGYGKRQMNLNVNVDFAGELERAIKRSGKVLPSSLPVAVASHPTPTNGAGSKPPSPDQGQPHQLLRRRA